MRRTSLRERIPSPMDPVLDLASTNSGSLEAKVSEAVQKTPFGYLASSRAHRADISLASAKHAQPASPPKILNCSSDALLDRRNEKQPIPASEQETEPTMTINFRPKELERVRGVRAASRKTLRASFCGIVPWFDLNNLMGPSRTSRCSFEGIVEFESLLEHDFLVLARSDGTTWRVRHQPRKVKWWDPRSDKERMHIPDFEVHRRGSRRPVYIQVKPQEQADRLKEELNLIEKAFVKQGLAFELWTDTKIRRQPRFGNAVMLFEHAGPREDVEALDRVREVLRAAPSILTIAQIRKTSGIEGRVFGAVMRLHILREVELDLEKPIDLRALVRPLASI